MFPFGKQGKDSFYRKSTTASGIPVVSSALVSDIALSKAKEIVEMMLEFRPDIGRQLARNLIKVAVMAETEKTTDIPEHSDLNREFPIFDWNTRCRGVAATIARPVCSVGEENLLQKQTDRYIGSSVLIHEYAHTILITGIDTFKGDNTFRERLVEGFGSAKSNGLWEHTYAGTNVDEYWAVGAQTWFDANVFSETPDGVNNHVNTRGKLLDYDPTLYGLLAEVFSPKYKWISGDIRLIS